MLYIIRKVKGCWSLKKKPTSVHLVPLLIAVNEMGKYFEFRQTESITVYYSKASKPKERGKEFRCIHMCRPVHTPHMQCSSACEHLDSLFLGSICYLLHTNDLSTDFSWQHQMSQKCQPHWYTVLLSVQCDVTSM